MFRVLFDWREVERKGPNFHYLVRIIIKKKEKKKEKGNVERKAFYGPHQFLIFSPPNPLKKIHIPLGKFYFFVKLLLYSHK